MKTTNFLIETGYECQLRKAITRYIFGLGADLNIWDLSFAIPILKRGHRVQIYYFRKPREMKNKPITPRSPIKVVRHNVSD